MDAGGLGKRLDRGAGRAGIPSGSSEPPSGGAAHAILVPRAEPMDRRAALSAVLALAAATAVQAQSSCEQFRDRLAERIEAGAKGMALEIAPGSATVPPGAKVVGTCEGGARKVLLFRSVAAAATWAAGLRQGTAASEPAPAVPVAAARPTEAKAAASAAAPARAPAAEPPAARAEPPAATPVESPVVRAADGPPAPAADPAPAAAAEAVLPGEPAAPPTSFAARLADWLRQRWPWFAVPAGLLLAIALGVWIAYRRAYDEQGLPRGPRLRA